MGLVLATLVLRLLHLASAASNPFSYHLGPDEDYYLQFGQWVAGLASGDPAEFGFMDPAYGYLLGFIFKLFGPNQFLVLFVQALVDSVTTFCIFLIGRELGRSRAGFYGAIFYALTSTAILYSATFLKVSWVANALVLWTLFSLVLLRTPRLWPWLAFGVFCAWCIALRGNLILLALFSFLALPSLYRRQSGTSMEETFRRILLLSIGMIVPLTLLASVNQKHSGSLSPLPSNGGIVLHQVYNQDNPRAESWYPPFVAYTHPSEIMRGYAREARSRTGEELDAAQVDRYWREQATAYIREHPALVLKNMARKTLEFSSASEVANNRSLADEKMFSPLLRILPSPFAWLFALGLPGLILLYRNNRNAVLVIAPVAVVVATFIVFFAEARFRFHAAGLFALGAGLFVDQWQNWFDERKFRPLRIGILATVILFGVSQWSGSRLPSFQTSWEGIAWGYIKMGDLAAAETTLASIKQAENSTAKLEEARAFIAWSKQDFEKAKSHYLKAVELSPGSHIAHYNLAMTLARTGDSENAMRHARMALEISPLAEYQQLIQQLGGN